jgi:hypothetical protein
MSESGITSQIESGVLQQHTGLSEIRLIERMTNGNPLLLQGLDESETGSIRPPS